jgi:hypothetical protein
MSTQGERDLEKERNWSKELSNCEARKGWDSKGGEGWEMTSHSVSVMAEDGREGARVSRSVLQNDAAAQAGRDGRQQMIMGRHE